MFDGEAAGRRSGFPIGLEDEGVACAAAFENAVGGLAEEDGAKGGAVKYLVWADPDTGC